MTPVTRVNPSLRTAATTTTTTTSSSTSTSTSTSTSRGVIVLLYSSPSTSEESVCESLSSSKSSNSAAPLLPPGERENEYFAYVDESVHYWKTFRSMGNEENLRQIQAILSDKISLIHSSWNTNLPLQQQQNVLPRAYWASHLVRSGYFTMNAMLGSIATDVHEQWRKMATKTNTHTPTTTTNTDTTTTSTDTTTITTSKSSSSMVSNLLQSDIPSRLLLETLLVYEQDYHHIQAGRFKYPWDALIQINSNNNRSSHFYNRIQFNSHHRQSNPFFVLSETAKAIQESVAIFSRRSKQGKQQQTLWIGTDKNNNNNHSRNNPYTTTTTTTTTTNGTNTKTNSYASFFYPDYYLNDFHYQTDGWMSTKSAQRYEIGTETLFLGRQDAMQRQTLLPLLMTTKTKPMTRTINSTTTSTYNNTTATNTTTPTLHDGLEPQSSSSSSSSSFLHNNNYSTASILEIGCGTGRFATFCRDHFPHAKMTLLDLSPYYLEQARYNDELWCQHYYREQRQSSLSSSQKQELLQSSLPSTTFVHANAEHLPFANNTFDVVICIYMFHEVPSHHSIRKRIAQEMIRVVKAGGGKIIITDTMQYGDRSNMSQIANFANLNEPHYQQYVQHEFLPDLFHANMMNDEQNDASTSFAPSSNKIMCDQKYMTSSTKTTSFVKL